MSDIENLISKHPDIELAAVIGLPDDEWGERPHAIVTARAGAKVDRDAVVAHMQQYIEVIRDELKWNETFGRSQSKLVAAARQAREEIARGKATPMNVKDL